MLSSSRLRSQRPHLGHSSEQSPESELRSVGGLKAGDVGTIVYVQGGGEAFEVEFTEPGGRTVAIATIQASQARRATKEDIANCRFRPKTADMAASTSTELRQEP